MDPLTLILTDSEAVLIDSEVFCKKGVLKNFAKFTGKQLCQSLFSNKDLLHFIRKDTLAQVFSCEFCKNFKNTIFYRTTPVTACVDMMILDRYR